MCRELFLLILNPKLFVQICAKAIAQRATKKTLSCTKKNKCPFNLIPV